MRSPTIIDWPSVSVKQGANFSKRPVHRLKSSVFSSTSCALSADTVRKKVQHTLENNKPRFMDPRSMIVLFVLFRKRSVNDFFLNV